MGRMVFEPHRGLRTAAEPHRAIDLNCSSMRVTQSKALRPVSKSQSMERNSGPTNRSPNRLIEGATGEATIQFKLSMYEFDSLDSSDWMP